MPRPRPRLATLLGALLVLSSRALPAQDAPAGPASLRLWYRTPARSWNEALPVGNGRLGAMVFGGAPAERLQLNEDTLWSGGPREWDNPKAKELLPRVREAVFRGAYAEADRLSKGMQGPYTESYMPMGALLLELEGHDRPTGYARELDLERAVATVRYSVGDATFTREVFSSAPDQVIVVRVTSDRPGRLAFRLRLDSALRHQVRGEGSSGLVLHGRCPRHVEPDYRTQFKDEEAVVYDPEGGEGMRFNVQVRVLAEGGVTAAPGGSVNVAGADAATILVSAATSFNGFDRPPGRQGRDPAPIAAQTLRAAEKKPYAALLSAHVADYRRYFRRVSLDLGTTPAAERPTDERIQVHRAVDDPALFTLLFQYGRYLLISSSRPGTQPANLQGIWSEHLRPPWSSNWCLDVDAEMTYWPVEVTNLAEMHGPFLQMAADLAATGQRTAAVNYGARGWCAHHNTDLWRQSGPAGDWGEGNPHWASWAMAGPWLCQHVWEHYAFGGDRDYLRAAWPVLKGAAEFLLDWLVEDPQGRLVTNPSVSPENTFVLPDGTKAQTSAASTMDMTLARELFTTCAKAADVLGAEPDFRARVLRARERLRWPPGIGRHGQLMEWSEDWESADPTHRHLSLLYGLFPGSEISPLTTPDLARAARCSLELRGPGDTSWSFAWKACLRARLGEGDTALDLLGLVLSYTPPDATGWKGGVFPNLLTNIPPHVLVNGNTASTAAIAEMLLQSHLGEIHLLPALPARWARGRVAGLRARGGFEVDLEWDEGQVRSARVRSRLGLPCRLRAASRLRVFAGGRPVPTRPVAPGVFEFGTRAGGDYALVRL